MAKKTAKKKVAKKKVVKKATAHASNPVNKIQDYTQEIWLAGLGAFALAQQEGGKIIEQGSKLFEKLVAEGGKLESKGRKAASDTVGGIKGDVDARVGKIRASAKTNWDKLEKVFEQRVARALAGLGVPTADEIRELTRRVAELNTQVAKLASSRKTAKPAAAEKNQKLNLPEAAN